MTHEYAGKYATKHSGVDINEKIAALIKDRVTDNMISCAEAHKIARELEVAPIDVGTTLDLLEVRINKCQLGLFGYGEVRKVTQVKVNNNPEITQAIKAALVNDRLPCASAWEIAEKFGLARIEVSAAAEKMKIKITSCQIGAFK